jgi:hypothetical protein
MRKRALLLGMALWLSGPAALWSQIPREVLIADWERSRDAVLAMVDAMPEAALGFRPTPDVRTFAEQIEHIVQDNVRITATGVLDGAGVPALEGQGAHLSSKAALRRFVEQGYAYTLDALAAQSEADLARTGLVFGRYEVPRWRALQGALEHATWTLGQLVPYLRLNGITPPGYQIF